MKKLLFSESLEFILILILAVLLCSLLVGRLYPIHLIQQKLFFFDLIEVDKNIPHILIYVFGLVNYLLIWSVSKQIFAGKKALIPLLIFSLSPWPAYLIFAGSFYIYLLMLIMVSFLGVMLIKQGGIKLGGLFFITGNIISLYSSLLMLIVFPVAITLLIITKFISFKKIRFSILLTILFCLPLFVSMIKNPVGMGNIYNNQIMVFSDPSIFSATNQFQGASGKEGFKIFSKFTENKYIYISKFLLLKSIKNITPVTFFTPQEKLLGFSFSPPILFGFLTPFLYGLYLILSLKNLRGYLFGSLVFIIPSFLSKLTVDLNRLVLFAPIIVFIISFGLINLAKHKNKIVRIILFLSLVLVLVQFLVTMFDINVREYPRYERTLEGRFEIEKQ